MADFRDLRVCKDAMNLCKSIYELTSEFPKNEQYVLVSQMRRSALSVASNIAEGSGRQHRKEFVHFLYTARGSLYELITQLDLCAMIQLIDNPNKTTIVDCCDDLGRGINALITSMKDSTRISASR